MSTTGPITWTTLPTLVATGVVAVAVAIFDVRLPPLWGRSHLVRLNRSRDVTSGSPARPTVHASGEPHRLAADLARQAAHPRGFSPASGRPGRGWRSYSASAPDTTSMISRVIAACRTLFMYRVRLSIISPEFRVAASIAVICAA